MMKTYKVLDGEEFNDRSYTVLAAIDYGSYLDIALEMYTHSDRYLGSMHIRRLQRDLEPEDVRECKEIMRSLIKLKGWI